MNVYHVTKFSLHLSFTVRYFYSKISCFTLFLSVRTVLSCFHLFFFSILRNSQLESDIKSDMANFAINETLNLCVDIKWPIWFALHYGSYCKQHYKIVFADIRKWHN